MQVHDADGQGQQAKLLTLALAVRGAETARLQVFWSIEAPALALKVLLQLVQALAPILGTEHQEKIIAADMADKVAGWVDPLAQAVGQAQQHFITLGIAVDVDEGISLFYLRGHANPVCQKALILFGLKACVADHF